MRMRFFRVLDPLSRLLPALLLAFALCWQAGIVRAHVHEAPNWSTAAHAQHPSKQQDDDQDCPLCAEAATAAAYLASAAPVLTPPLPAPLWREALSADPAPRVLRSHAWRSRAPPTLRTA